MSHASRYDDSDPYLVGLREICLSLPEAAEKVSHGHPAFYTKKIFSIFGAVIKGDHYNQSRARSVLFLPDPDERDALLNDERFFVPAYYGPSGWVALDFTTADVAWDEVRELVTDSYRNTALRRLVKQLELEN